MINRFVPLFCLLLPACDGFGGDALGANAPSPMLGALTCVDAIADRYDRARRNIVVVRTDTTREGTVTLLSVDGDIADYRCVVAPGGSITDLVPLTDRA